MMLGRFGHIEKDLERQITADLRARGYSVRTQVKTRWGFADIVIDEPHCIIELKRDSSPDSIWKAVGQLCFYGEQFPEARKFVGVRTRLHPAMVAPLAALGISEWTIGTIPAIRPASVMELDVMDADGVTHTQFVDELGMRPDHYRQHADNWIYRAEYARTMANETIRRCNKRYKTQWELPFPEPDEPEQTPEPPGDR